MLYDVEELKIAANRRLSEIQDSIVLEWQEAHNTILRNIRKKNSKGFFRLFRKKIKEPSLYDIRYGYNSREFLGYLEDDWWYRPEQTYEILINNITLFLAHLGGHIGDTVHIYAKDVEYYSLGRVISYVGEIE